jgi:hypothetical protein
LYTNTISPLKKERHSGMSKSSYFGKVPFLKKKIFTRIHILILKNLNGNEHFLFSFHRPNQPIVKTTYVECSNIIQNNSGTNINGISQLPPIKIRF